MSATVFRISVGFLVGVLALLALSLSLATHYVAEQQRLSAAGDPLGALEAGRLAIRLDPFDTNALETQSLILQQQKRYDEAAATLREAVQRNPNDYLPYLLLGALQFQRNELDAASQSYREALRLNPRSIASVSLAQTYVRQGKLEEAKKLYLLLKKQNQASFENLYDLGRIEVRTGAPEQGLKDIRRAKREAEAGLNKLNGPLKAQRQKLLTSMDLALADAMVVAGRYDQARRVLSKSTSSQAPALLQLLYSDPQKYRDQVVHSGLY